MQVTMFGIIWFLILVVAGIVSQKSLIKCVFLSGLFQAGAIFIVGNAVVNPLTFSCLIYIIGCICRGKKGIKIPKFFYAFLFMWVVFLSISVLSSELFRGISLHRLNGFLTYIRYVYQGEISFYGLFELLLYGITAVLLYNEKPFNQIDLDNLINSAFWIVLIIGVWQYTTKLGLIPRIFFLENLVYSNTASDSIAYYNYTHFVVNIAANKMYSSFMEPSYFAGFLNPILYYYLLKFISGKNNMKDLLKAILVFIMIILTLSTTAISLSLIVVLFIIIQLKDFRRIMKALSLLVIGILILGIIINYTGLWDSLIKASIEKASSTSAKIRDTWNQACLQAFEDTHGIGIGLGNIRGSSFIFTLLGNVGVIGTLCYLLFIISILRTKILTHVNYNNTQNANISSLKIMLIICIAAQIISIGNYNYSVFWILLFLIVSCCSTYANYPISHTSNNRTKELVNVKK